MHEFPAPVSLAVAIRAIERARQLGRPVDLVFTNADDTHLATLSIEDPAITLTVEGLRGSTMSDDMLIDMWLGKSPDGLPRHCVYIGPNGCALDYLGENREKLRVLEVM